MDELMSMATGIRAKFATADAAEDEKQKENDWNARSIYFIWDTLIFFEFEAAVSHADAGRKVLRGRRYVAETVAS